MLIGQRVAERVDGTIEITEPVGDVVQYTGHSALRTEAND